MRPDVTSDTVLLRTTCKDSRTFSLTCRALFGMGLKVKYVKIVLHTFKKTCNLFTMQAYNLMLKNIRNPESSWFALPFHSSMTTESGMKEHGHPGSF